MATEQPQKRSRLKKILLISASLLLVLLIAGVLLVPTIASSLAPGIIESQAAKAINGRVQARGVSISWNGPVTIDALELQDEAGKPLATLRAQSSLGILSALGSLKDLGTLTLSGKVDIISQRLADGTTTSNLQRAIAPRQSTTASPTTAQGTSSGLPRIRAKVDITGLDVSFTQLDVSGTATAKGQITGAKGVVSVDTNTSGNAAGGLLDAQLAASVASDGGASPLTINAKASDFVSGAGALDLKSAKVDIAADAQQFPVALVDAIAGTTGVLTDALGPDASLKLIAKGGMANLNADIDLKSANTNADAGLNITASRVTLTRPATMEARSTQFLSRFPAAQSALTNAGINVESFPSARLSLTTLNIKLPDGPTPMDLRAGAVDGSLLISAAAARVRMPEAGAPTPAPGTPATGTNAPTRLVQTTPIDARITSTDLAKSLTIQVRPVQIRIDSADAGELSLSATAQDLATEAGAPRSLPGSLNADALVRALDLRLVQPFLVAANLPIDLLRDAGPRAEISLSARTVDGQPGVIDSVLAIDTLHMKLNADLRVTDTTIDSSRGSTIRIDSLAPIVNAAMNRSSPGTTPSQTVRVSGTAPLNATAKFKVARSLNMETLELDASADIGAMTIDLARPGQADERFDLRSARLAIVGAPKSDPRITIESTLSTRGGDALVKGDLTVRGVSIPSTDPSVFALGARRVVGDLSVTDLSTALVSAFIPSAPGKPDLAALVRDSIGPSLNMTMSMRTDGPAQVAGLTVRSTKLSVDSGLTLSSQRIAIAQSTASLLADDATIAGLTTYASLTEPGAPRPRMTEPATVRLTIGAMTIPTNDAGLNFAAAGDSLATVAITTDAPIIVRGLSLPDQRTFDGGLANLRLNSTLPLASLATSGASAAPAAPRPASAARIKLTAGADLIEAGAASSPVASFTADLNADASFGDLRGEVKISALDTLRADRILNQPGVVSGALGDRADIDLTAARPGDPNAPLDITLAIKSSRLVTSPIRFTQGPDRMGLSQPVELTWTIDPAFANATFLAPSTSAAAGNAPTTGARNRPPAAAQPTEASLALVEPVVLKGRLTQLTLSRSTDATLTDGGMFKPGVLNVDLALDVTRLVLESRAGALQDGAARAPERLALAGINATVKAGGQANNNTLAIVMNVASVDGSPTPIKMDAKIVRFATANGAMAFNASTIDADLSAPTVPTALIDKLASSGQQLRDLLGPQMSLNLRARDFSPSGGEGTKEGTLSAKFVSAKARADAGATVPGNSAPATTPAQRALPTGRAGQRDPAPNAGPPVASTKPALEQQASLEIAGPVRNGALRVQSSAPLNISLAQFDFGSDTKIMGILPLFASVKKQAGSSLTPALPANAAPGLPASAPVIDTPLTITSRDLVLPTDGDVAKLNGILSVNPGRIDYIFKRQFGQFLDSAIFTGAGSEQIPVPAFDITIVNGIASYQDVALPIRNFTFKTEGRVDLATSTVDAVIYIPTIAASQGLMSKLNADLGSGFGRILPDVLTEGTMIPIRARGPMNDPAYSIDIELFFKNFGKQLSPSKIIDGVGKGIGDILNRALERK